MSQWLAVTYLVGHDGRQVKRFRLLMVSITSMSTTSAGVTQLAESQFSKLLVASSSLVSRSKEHSHEIIG